MSQLEPLGDAEIEELEREQKDETVQRLLLRFRQEQARFPFLKIAADLEGWLPDDEDAPSKGIEFSAWQEIDVLHRWLKDRLAKRAHMLAELINIDGRTVYSMVSDIELSVGVKAVNINGTFVKTDTIYLSYRDGDGDAQTHEIPLEMMLLTRDEIAEREVLAKKLREERLARVAAEAAKHAQEERDRQEARERRQLADLLERYHPHYYRQLQQLKHSGLPLEEPTKDEEGR